jgi:hypothetical protein
MANVHTPDHQSQFLLFMLMILGTLLAIVGWYRWATYIF